LKVLITGADGFLGSNLQQHLLEDGKIELRRYLRSNAARDLPRLLEGVDFVFHLAGVNRPDDERDFVTGNAELTQTLCDALAAELKRNDRPVPVVFASSTQAELPNAYGQSKRAAEQSLLGAMQRSGLTVRIFRLPNVFGKWAKPNYNSAVATFCYNIARDLPIQVHNAQAALQLVHVDQVVARFRAMLDGDLGAEVFCTVEPQYTTTVGEVAEIIRGFRLSRQTLVVGAVGVGLTRALYATYVSYLPAEHFSYEIPLYGDARGVFVEMLRTRESGQFSYFTAHPGVTRGGHYHHSKTEKFLVIRGTARFRFRHLQTGESREILTSGEKPLIVQTAPGWTHDITNVGSEEMYVMLWANEIFDREHPDTFPCPL
jgi:UDP-2-acetamido-2,6-beta-L-arabino-hexul-4-ose reductase